VNQTESEIPGSDVMHDLVMLLAGSKTASGYVRSVATHSLLGAHAVGSELFIVNQDATLQTLAAFGKTTFSDALPISLWDQNPVSTAARTNQVTKGTQQDPATGDDVYLYCYPFSTPAHTVGVLVMIKSEEYEIALEEQDQRTVSMFGGLWLESLGLSDQTSKPTSTAKDSTELTVRQLAVLKMMAQGQTNAQIADQMILSESTIRQETVKIYRKLAVSDRAQATKRAMHLGLIDRIAS
jgi:DNA-binding CsgD family transcriptional regulator